MEKRIELTFKKEIYVLPLATKIKHIKEIEIQTKRIAPDILDLAQTNEGNWLFRLLRGCIIFSVLMDDKQDLPKGESSCKFSKLYWGNKTKMLKWLEEGDFEIGDPIANEIVKNFDTFWIERSQYIKQDGLYYTYAIQEEKKNVEKTEEQNQQPINIK